MREFPLFDKNLRLTVIEPEVPTQNGLKVFKN